MDQNKSYGLADFLKANAWAILALLVLLGGFYASVNLRLDSVQAQGKETAEKLEVLTDIVQRIVVLEEHDKSFSEDLSEMKADLKDIKSALR